MIKVDNLSYSFPQKNLFDNISFSLEDGEHAALIGTSGSGKSTLINIIMNPEQYLYDGKIEVASDLRIGYVSQFYELEESSQITVFEYISESFVKLQQEIDTICAAMETSSEIETLLEQYQQALDQFDAIGGDDYESIISKKLYLANLSNHADLPISKLSGGEFKLVQVIKEMLTAPNLLIMDEPDVFLDFENLNSLRNLINTHKGIMLVITHNRYLLNHCFNKILHLENTELQEFRGRYIDYNFTLLQSKIELQELAEADAEEIARHEKIIDRFRTAATRNAEASRGKSLHARVSLLERLEARRIKPPFVEIKQPKIRLKAEPREEETTLLKVTDYHVSFQDLLLENVNFEISSSDKVALIGPNGTGKTTLLRDIYKNNHSAITIEEDSKVAFLSQIQGEMLNESNTILDEFFDAGFKSNGEIASYLLGYGLKDEVLNQKIGSLSGGEKNILQLAKIGMDKTNLLLLDEPTSHLDTYSQMALEKAMENYKGAILMVSHDFYTIANCMDYVLLIEDKTIRKMSIRKFRKMIYAKHLDKDYLDLEQKKKAIETKIEQALSNSNFANAKVLSEELEPIIQAMVN